MRSWKTTLGGSLAGLGAFLWGAPVAAKAMEIELDPMMVKWCVIIGLIANAGGVFFMGLFGRDNNVTSEDVKSVKAEKEQEKAVNDWLGGKGTLWLLTAILGATLLTTPGCNLLSPKSPVTWEASRFNSFKSVWLTTLALYDAQMDRRVAGKISEDDARDIDAAWNAFRVAYRVALAEARGDETQFTPENVRKLANDVLTLIYATQ